MNLLPIQSIHPMSSSAILEFFRPRAMTVGLLLFIFLFACSRTRQIQGQSPRFGIVTAEHGYVVAEDDEILETMGPFSIVDILTEEKTQSDSIQSPWLRVKTLGGEEGWMRSESLHLSSWFDNITDKNAGAIRKAFEEFAIAYGLNREGDFEDASKRMNAALAMIQSQLGMEDTLYAWLLSSMAFGEYEAGRIDQAKATHLKAQKIFQRRNAMKSLHAADLLNLQAILAQSDSNGELAIAYFKEALQISTEILGENHSDVRVISCNLASAYAQAKDFEFAIKHQRKAQAITAIILPADVLERVEDHLRMAQYLMDARRFTEAKGELLEAKLITDSNPDLSQTLEIDASLKLGEAYILLGDIATARRRLQESLTELLALPTSPEDTSEFHPYLEIAYRLLGKLEVQVERWEVAFGHFEKSLTFLNPEEPTLEMADSAREAGKILVKLQRNPEAAKHFRLAIELFQKVEGMESDQAAEVSNLLAAIDSEGKAPSKDAESVGTYFFVSASQGYLSDNSGTIITSVPSGTLVKKIGEFGDRIEIEMDGGRKFIRKEMVRGLGNLFAPGEAFKPETSRIFQALAKGRNLQDLGDHDDAQVSFIEAVEETKKRFGEKTPFHVFTTCFLSSSLAQRGDLLGAEQVLDQQAEFLQQLAQDRHPVVIEVLNVLALIRFLNQDLDNAKKMVLQAIELQKADHKEQSIDFAMSQQALVMIELNHGEFRSAQTRQEKVMAIVSAIFPTTSLEFAESQSVLGLTMAMNGLQDKGLGHLENSVATARTLPSKIERSLSILQSYGLMLKALGRANDAEKILGEVIQKLPQPSSLPAINMKLIASVENADLASASGRHQRAIELANEGTRLIDVIQAFPGVNSKPIAIYAIRLHEILIASYQKIGNGGKVKSHTDALAKWKRLSQQPSEVSKSNDLDLNESVSDASTRVDGSKDANFSADRGHQLIPETEWMVVAKQTTAILVAPNGTRIGTANKDARLWSIELSKGWHRIKIPGKDQFGWIHQENLVAMNDVLMASMLEQIANDVANKNLNEKVVSQKTDEVLATFRRAMDHGAKGRTLEAVQAFELALNGSREVLGENNPLSAMVQTELIGAYLNAKQFSKVRNLLDQVQPVTRKFLGENHPRVALDAWRMATLLGMLGDLRGAEKQLRVAVSVSKEAFGSFDVRTQLFRADHAQLLIQLGQFDQASAILNEILEFSSLANPSILLRARVELSKGLIAFHREDLSSAIAHLEKSIEEYSKLGEGANVNVGQTMFFLGMARMRNGDLAGAEAILEKGAQLLATIEGDSSTVSHQIGQIRATIAFLNGNLEQASMQLEESMEGTLRAFGKDHISTGFLRTQIATLHAAQGNLDRSIAEFASARKTIFNYVQETLSDLPVKEQSAFLRLQDKRELDRSLSLSLHPVANQSIHAHTAEWLINARNLPHELSSRSGQVRRLLSQPTDIQLYESYRSARERLATMPTGISDSSEQRFRAEEAQKQNALIETSFRALPNEVQKQIEAQKGRFLSIEEIQAAIPTDETLVEILRMRPLGFSDQELRRDLDPKRRLPEEYVAWIVPPKNKNISEEQEIQVVRLGDANQIDQQVAQLLSVMQKSFQSIRTLGHLKANQEILEVSQPLSEKVWLPIQKALQGRTKVILSPDGELWRVPWSALPIKDKGLLVEEFELRLVISGRELVRKPLENLVLTAPLILADPDYDATERDVRDALKAILPIEAQQKNGQGPVETFPLRANLTRRATRLPGTAIEARAVVADIKRLASREPTMCLRAQASEEVLRRSRNPYTVMLSTHGFFQPLQKKEDSTTNLLIPSSTFPNPAHGLDPSSADPLMRCGLLLAGCNQKNNGESANDGVLLGREIVQIDLRGTQLVVLSACETGLGDVADGEGIAGLRQAFQLAGAESVVSTLWSIDDQETSRLMTEFFGQLSSGQSKPAALRLAQLKRIEALRQRHGAAHPFFWAPFTLTGDK